jgi:hypothetical protein
MTDEQYKSQHDRAVELMIEAHRAYIRAMEALVAIEIHQQLMKVLKSLA